MFLIPTIFLFLAASDSSYGGFYWLDQQKPAPTEIRIGMGYGFNLSNDYVENHSLLTQVEFFPANFWTLGILGQISSGSSSQMGKELKNLETVDIQTKIYALDGAVFAFTGIDLMRGAWNFFNGGIAKSRLSVGAGYGWILKNELTTKESKNEGSYLWKADAAFTVYDPVEIYISLLGHRAEHYISAGLQLSLNSQSKPKI